MLQFLLQVALGEKAGAIGMIIFNDPSDYARGKTTYPDSWWLPPDGVQRGAIVIHEGDPLTPGYPATGKYLTDYLFIYDCLFY